MTDRLEAALAALRKLAIIPKQAGHVSGRVEYDGFRCRCCNAAWLNAAPEIHAPECPLNGSQP